MSWFTAAVSLPGAAQCPLLSPAPHARPRLAGYGVSGPSDEAFGVIMVGEEMTVSFAEDVVGAGQLEQGP